MRPGECDSSQPVQQPYEDEQQHDDGRGENGENDSCKAEKEDVVAPGVAMRLLQVADHEAVVAAVGFPGDIEDVAEERDGADDHVEAEIDEHADERDVRDAANPCSEDEDGGGDAGEDVAEAGDEADEAVEAEADGGAGDAEPVVEQMGEQVEIFVGEKLLGAGAEAGAGGAARRQKLRTGMVGHEGTGRGGAPDRCAANATIRMGMAAIVQRQNA